VNAAIPPEPLVEALELTAVLEATELEEALLLPPPAPPVPVLAAPPVPLVPAPPVPLAVADADAVSPVDVVVVAVVSPPEQAATPTETNPSVSTKREVQAFMDRDATTTSLSPGMGPRVGLV
jgi:hypothetical protein